MKRPITHTFALTLTAALLLSGCPKQPSGNPAPKTDNPETAAKPPPKKKTAPPPKKKVYPPLSAAPPHIYRFRLKNRKLTDDQFAKWLAGQPETTRPVLLDLRGNRLTRAAVDNLLASKLKPILNLTLSGNPISDAGVKAIARSKVASSLMTLSLESVGMTDKGARALAASPHLKMLDELAVGGNKLTLAGVAALKTSKTLAKCKVYFEE